MQHEASGRIGHGSIFPIAGDGMTYGLHLHTDLILSSGFKIELQKGIFTIALQYLVMSDSDLAIVGGGKVYLHLLVFREI